MLACIKYYTMSRIWVNERNNCRLGTLLSSILQTYRVQHLYYVNRVNHFIKNSARAHVGKILRTRRTRATLALTHTGAESACNACSARTDLHKKQIKNKQHPRAIAVASHAPHCAKHIDKKMCARWYVLYCMMLRFYLCLSASLSWSFLFSCFISCFEYTATTWHNIKHPFGTEKDNGRESTASQTQPCMDQCTAIKWINWKYNSTVCELQHADSSLKWKSARIINCQTTKVQSLVHWYAVTRFYKPLQRMLANQTCVAHLHLVVHINGC